MNFQREYVHRRTRRSPVYSSHDMNDILDIFREVVYDYNENMRYHSSMMETYQQNVSTSLGLLNTIIHHINYSDRNWSEDRRPSHMDQTYQNTNWRSRSREFQREPEEQRNTQLSDTDITSLIYMFLSPLNNNTNLQANSVPVPLTEQQITDATEIVPYQSSMTERRCPISLEDFVENEEICHIRGCGHIFKKSTLLRWFQTQTRCPVCRYNLRDFVHNVNQNSTNATQNHPTRPRSRSLEIDTSAAGLSRPPPFLGAGYGSSSQTQGYPRTPRWSLPPGSQRGGLWSESSLSPHNTTNDRESFTHDVGLNTTNTQSLYPNTNQDIMPSSQITHLLTTIIQNQIPALDNSNNLLYTFELPVLM